MTEKSLETREQQNAFILGEDLRRVMIALSWPAVIAMVLWSC